jgi:hypothetical protein
MGVGGALLKPFKYLAELQRNYDNQQRLQQAIARANFENTKLQNKRLEQLMQFAGEDQTRQKQEFDIKGATEAADLIGKLGGRGVSYEDIDPSQVATNPDLRRALGSTLASLTEQEGVESREATLERLLAGQERQEAATEQSISESKTREQQTKRQTALLPGKAEAAKEKEEERKRARVEKAYDQWLRTLGQSQDVELLQTEDLANRFEKFYKGREGAVGQALGTQELPQGFTPPASTTGGRLALDDMLEVYMIKDPSGKTWPKEILEHYLRKQGKLK